MRDRLPVQYSTFTVQPGYRDRAMEWPQSPEEPMWAELMVWVIALVVGFIIGYAVATAQAPHCFEDEVVMWDGNGHTICVPIDNLP